MKKGQSTLEYICLIGFSAAALVAIIVYIGRGFQGNVRSLSDQIGAGQYDPGNTVTNNLEVKRTVSHVSSSSSSTTSYGSGGSTSTSSTSGTEDDTRTTTTKNIQETIGNLRNDVWR